MAKKAHVPKFGNWDGDNVPYTSYFDNARKGKGGAGKAFNPNDPQENPDAFLSGIFPAGRHEGRKSRDGTSLSPAEEHEGRRTSRDGSSSSSGDQRRRQSKYGSDDSADDCDFNMETPPRGTTSSRSTHRNGNSGYTGNRSAETTPELFRGNKKPEESVLRRRSASPPPPPQRRPVPKSGRRVDAMHETPSSVPRFGAWDDANPDSGDGFTMIFNKVKQEKQIAANKVPRNPPAVPKVHSSLRSNHAKSSSKPKISCCMLPPTRD